MAVVVQPTIVEMGFGDVAMTCGSSNESIAFLFHNLGLAVGVGGKTPENFHEYASPNIIFSFPKDSADSLDVVISALQNLRDKYYKDAPVKFTKESNPLRDIKRPHSTNG